MNHTAHFVLRHGRRITRLMAMLCGKRIIAFATVAVLLTAASLRGQVSTASINGTVRDTSAAVIPGVSVALRNVATGVELTTSTDSVGVYVLVNIPPGRYDLRVSKTGFQVSERSNLALAVNQSTTLDFTLRVGSSTQTISVHGGATTLETSTSELGAVVAVQEVNNLPLNGRNFTQLLQLTPGASPVDVAQTFAFRAVGEYDVPSINGQRNRSNLFLVDGINDQGGTNDTYAVPPILDDIEEFKVDSHNDQVQFGGVAGGVVNVVTKSGSNHLHGAGWEYLRNSAFDARNPFFAKVQPLRQNQFGANVGGPVLLPHYNGRNRTFFFGSYEGFRNHEPNQTLGLIPTPAELSGDLSALGTPIYNPFSTEPDPNKPGEFLRTAFPGGMIPSTLLDPTAAKLAAGAYPAPNVTGISGTNFSATTPAVSDQDEYHIRVDQQLGTNNSLWFQFSHVSFPTTSFDPIGQGNSTVTWLAHTLGVNWTHSFGPTAVLQAQFGRTYAILDTAGGLAGGLENLTGKFASTYACGFIGSRACLLPSTSLTGFLGVPGDNTSIQGVSDIWSGRANLSKLHGKHLFNLGFEVNTNALAPETILTDTISFGTLQTANLESPSNTGSALASLLLGVPVTGLRRNESGSSQTGWVDGIYFGDQWKPTDHLTVNMGLRWDFTLEAPWGSASNLTNAVGQVNLNNGTYVLQDLAPPCSQTGVAPCIPGSGLPAHVVVSPNGRIFDTNYRGFAPRLGLAYQLNSKTVLRASGGIFYDNWGTYTQLEQSVAATWPNILFLNAQDLNANIPNVTAENPISSIGAGALPSPTPFTNVEFYKDASLGNPPYSEQWNLGFQRQLPRSTVLSVDYVGSHDGRLNLGTYGNTAVTPGPGAVAPRTPYPYITPTTYDRAIGRSNYSALDVSLNKRYSNGLSVLVSYTWSKSMDIACSGYASVEGCENQNPYNLNADESVSGYDLTNILSASWVYQLPFGAKKRFASSSRVLNGFIGGWDVNGILSLHSGLPYTLVVDGDIANTGDGENYERPNLVGNPHVSNPSPAQWFNTAAFKVPAAFTYGDLGRNTMRSDPFKDLDISLFREFPVTESKHFEFRVEAFNITNTPIWGTPGSTVNAPNFGRVLNTYNTPRQLQLALKFYW